jgi:hypothetical protein|tara:strand:- start:78 stop:278 length:201 start_codon:yes stop_codon:yes gene_type:complete
MVWGPSAPHYFLLMEKKMEVLSEVNVGNVIKPIKKLFEKKREPQFLEEQIRDQVPTDKEEEKNEKI